MSGGLPKKIRLSEASAHGHRKTRGVLKFFDVFAWKPFPTTIGCPRAVEGSPTVDWGNRQKVQASEPVAENGHLQE